jgi:hypothetical protein
MVLRTAVCSPATYPLKKTKGHDGFSQPDETGIGDMAPQTPSSLKQASFRHRFIVLPV